MKALVNFFDAVLFRIAQNWMYPVKTDILLEFSKIKRNFAATYYLDFPKQQIE